ncbi:alpha/beta hydrolase [Streptomyces mayteni]
MFDLDVFTAGNYHSECEAWPATPPEGGIAMARALGGSLLTVDGKQHGAYLLGRSGCVDDVVDAYLLDLEPPPTDARCGL